MNLRNLITTASNDPKFASLGSSERMAELKRLGAAQGIVVTEEAVRAELDQLSESDLDQVAGGDGSWWGKMPNHNLS